MEALFENPGLLPLLENVLGNLDWKTFLQCRLVSKSVKNVIDNPNYSVKKMFLDGRNMYRDISDDIKKIKTLLNEFPKRKVEARVWNHFKIPSAYDQIFQFFENSSELEVERNQELEWKNACQNPDGANYSLDKSIHLYVLKKHRYLSEYQFFQSANGLENVLQGLRKLCNHETKRRKTAHFISKTLNSFTLFIMINIGILYQNLKFNLLHVGNCFHCQNQEPIECNGCINLKINNYDNLSHLLDLCIYHRSEQITEISESKMPMSNIIEIMRQTNLLKNK